MVLEYSKIAEKLFWGYDFSDGAYLATPEKAILDTLYLRRRLPVADEINWEFVDMKKLHLLAAQYPNTVRAMVRTPPGREIPQE